MAFSAQAMIAYSGLPKDLFKAMLDFLPADASIIGFNMDHATNLYFMFITSDSFKEVPTGHIPPEITANFTRNFDGSANCTGVDITNAEDKVKIITGGPITVTLPKAIPNFNMPPTHKVQPFCIHDWTHYFGLNDSYEYCKDCGVKK